MAIGNYSFAGPHDVPLWWVFTRNRGGKAVIMLDRPCLLHVAARMFPEDFETAVGFRDISERDRLASIYMGSPREAVEEEARVLRRRSIDGEIATFFPRQQ